MRSNGRGNFNPDRRPGDLPIKDYNRRGKIINSPIKKDNHHINESSIEITSDDITTILKKNFLILSIFIVGILLRIINIGRESFWFDETLTGYRSQWTYPDLISNIAPIDQMPLYYTIIWFIGQNFGSNEIVLRLPSALFGALAIIPAYYIGKRYSKRTALFSAFLMAIIPTYVYYSQEARMYSLIILLSSIFFLFVLEYNDNILFSSRNKVKPWLIISGFLLLYTHYYSIIFVGLALGSTAVIEFLHTHRSFNDKIKSVINYSKPLIFTFMTIIPWLLFLQFFHSLEGHETAGGYALEPILIPETYLFLGGMYKLLVTPDHSIVFFFSVMIITLSILGCLFVLSQSIKKEKYRKLALISLPILIIPPIFSYLYSLNGMSIYAYRYFLFLVPFFILFPALIFDKLFDIIPHKRGKWFPIICATLILSMALISIHEMYINKEKEDWRSVSKYLDEVTNENDAVVPIPAWKQMVLFYYERDIDIVHFQPTDLDVNEKLNNYTAIWTVISLNYWYSDAEPILNQLTNWTQVSSKDFNGLLVRCYEKK